MATKAKQRRAPKRQAKRRGTSAASPAAPERAWALTLPTVPLLGLTLGLAALYFAYSFLSDGFYQHDEAGHFLSMRTFWHDPNAVLGNWAKPGYKLLYALPALFGVTGVTITNCLVAAFCCYVAYRLAEEIGCASPLFAFVLLAVQPFWLQLSARNYSEPVTALLLLLAILSHHQGRRLVAALLISYATTIRQEFYPLVGLYGLFLLYKKDWIPALALVTFPLLQHLWGWMATGDPLYLLHQVVGFSGEIQDAYPRQGFNHYFVTSLVVFGAFAVTLLIVYLGQVLFYKQRVHLFILAPLGVYVLEHAVFNLQLFTIGPSTGGNLRYMLIVAPLVAVLGGVAADRLPAMAHRAKLFWLLGPFAVAVFLFMRFSHNNIVLTDEVDPVPVVTTLAALALVLVPLGKKVLFGLLTSGCVVLALLAVRPFPLSSEDLMMQDVVAWAEANRVEERPVLASHPLFYYYYGLARPDFDEGAASISREALDAAEPGTFIVWDSHYSYRPALRENAVNYTELVEQPERFRLVRDPFITLDQRFGVFVFEKIAEAAP